jgi:DNA-binding transcriptional ArsR family regulator
MLLSSEKMSINAIADNFAISRPAISRHVKILSEAGFIYITDQGRERYCELSSEGFDRVREWVAYYEQFWHKKLKNLEKLLNKKHKK